MIEGASEAVALSDVTKRFDGVTAVEGLSVSVPAGALFGILGPNGAGKTTLLRLIVGIHEPESGVVVVMGRRPDDWTRRRLGYLPEERGLYRRMKVLEQLVFFGRLKGLSRRAAGERAAGWLERLGIGACRDRRLQELSKGMQQKVQFVAAVLHDPPLLVLDEPFAGLDPINARLFQEEIRTLHASGRTIILSTHRLDQAERLVGEICLVHRSRAVLAGDLSRIKRELGRGRVLLDWSGDPAALADAALVRSWARGPNGWELALRDGVDPQLLLRRAVEGGEVRRFQLLEPSLSEIYLSCVGEGAVEVGAGGKPGLTGPSDPEGRRA